MRVVLLIILSAAIAFSQVNPLAEEKIPIQPLLLPAIPSVEIVVPGSTSPISHAGSTNPRVSEDPGEIVHWKTGILYQRKKAGDQSLLLRSGPSAMVKLIDLDTRRLECLLWLDDDSSIELSDLPASHYGVIFCQGIRQQGERLIPGWFGTVDEGIDLLHARGRVTIELYVCSTRTRVVASTCEEYNRFNPPKSALSR